jgi:hypothetical protein
MAQTAMVKSAAGSDLWNSTSPSGSHASGETGRRIWMIGSKLLAKSLEPPNKKPSGIPIKMASA